MTKLANQAMLARSHGLAVEKAKMERIKRERNCWCGDKDVREYCQRLTNWSPDSWRSIFAVQCKG